MWVIIMAFLFAATVGTVTGFPVEAFVGALAFFGLIWLITKPFRG